MPATYTPPVLDPERHVHDGDHGAGRRPPTDKYTGGNGEGDNWSDRPVGSRGPRERLQQSRIGLLFGLGGVLLFFIATVTAFLATKGNVYVDAHNEIVSSWHSITLPRILLLNTAVLLISSVTAEIARRSMFREVDVMDEWIGLGKPTTKRALLWLSVTLALGIAFLAGQAVAWQQIASQSAFVRSLSSTHFVYLFTGLHALHLSGGIVGFVVALYKLRTSRQFATRRVWVDISVWYWHAMGVLWIALYALLAFGQ